MSLTVRFGMYIHVFFFSISLKVACQTEKDTTNMLTCTIKCSCLVLSTVVSTEIIHFQEKKVLQEIIVTIIFWFIKDCHTV